jgi:flagellin-specific chaperone FliS
MRIFGKYMNMPKNTHLEKAHHILEYLKVILDYGILY